MPMKDENEIDRNYYRDAQLSRERNDRCERRLIHGVRRSTQNSPPVPVAPINPTEFNIMQPTTKTWGFEHMLSAVKPSIMPDVTPAPTIISVMQLPRGSQLQLRLQYGNPKEKFEDFGFISDNNHFYDLLLDKTFNYSVTISAAIEKTGGPRQGAALSQSFSNGNQVEINPECPVPIVCLIGRGANAIKSEFKLTLTVHFTMPSTDATEVFSTWKVSHMRSHAEQLGSLLSLGHFADCKIFTDDGNFFDCHKALLCLKSEVIQKAFEAKNMTEAETNEINWDCSSNVASLILPYFYTGEMPTVTNELSMELYRLAHMYHMEGLRAYLAEEIMQKANKLVSVSNVLDFAVFADKFDLDSFKLFCLTFINGKRSEVISKNPGWKKFHSENLSMVEQLLLL